MGRREVIAESRDGIAAAAGLASAGGRRIVGVDIARGLAIIGMLVAHAIPRADESELLVDGRSSILFATLAGISLGIMTGSERKTEPGHRADRVASIAMRALVLFLLGVTLGSLGSEVAVILDYYAIMFLFLTPVLFLPRWVLGLVAAVLAVAAPAFGVGEADPTAGFLAYFAQYYLLTGYYPVLIWLPFLLVGLISARSGLGGAKTQLWMVAAGTISAVLGYGAALLLPGITAEAHSGSTAEVLGSGGFVVALIGGLLWLTSPERARVGTGIRAVLAPVGAAGSMALTVYTLQIITLAVFAVLRDETGGAVEYPGWPLLIGMTIVSLLFATFWRAFLGNGPLERLLGRVTRTQR
ncbi:DUF418 domain-containing protein [Cryobacterium sp. Hh11]|uniref:DUF418 domain-containing protein n=1 Tax=Cryobacterium sp. Hh11 TaxID=2555868 RepID=UPI00106A8FAB|nr:DUF418 domain-containing protein [Cryobacterium sp. Hh11]TFD50420.1 DUF418 domain-containing protein [Cryobacterium sp. Hh11]